MAQATEKDSLEVLEHAIKVLRNTPLGQNRIKVAEIILENSEALLMTVTNEVQSARDNGLI